MVFGTALITGSHRYAVIGDRTDLTESNDVQLQRLCWGEATTLYRVDDGSVGFGRPTDHGPSPAKAPTCVTRGFER